MSSACRREIGLRLAIGAQRSDIVRYFLGQGLRVVALGCVSGLALSFAFGRMLSSMLYGISPFDPATMSGVLILVPAVATLAALVPVMRAAWIEPMRALREE